MHANHIFIVSFLTIENSVNKWFHKDAIRKVFHSPKSLEMSQLAEQKQYRILFGCPYF